jgi:hypothetical protein
MLSVVGLRPICYSPSRTLNTTYAQDRSLTHVVRPKWNQDLRMFPTFAEYSQKQARDTRDGISDTGPSLRAFLPLPDKRERSMIQHYQGAAALVDTRVMCIRPNMTNATLLVGYPGASLMGDVSIPAELQSRPENSQMVTSWRLQFDAPQEPRSLNCSIGPPLYRWIGTTMGSDYYHDDDWQFNLCRFGSLGRVRSETMDMDDGSIEDVPELQDPYFAINVSGTLTELEGDGTILVRANMSTEGEWLHSFFKRDESVVASLIAQNMSAEFRISVSICFARFDGNTVSITANSPQNRTEPVAGPVSDTHRFADVRKQLGQFSDSIEKRGVLKLQEQDWIRNRRAFSSLKYIDSISRYLPEGPWIMFSQGGTFIDYEDLSRFASLDVAMMFQEILKTGGGLSFALQSVLTLFAGTAYYEQSSASVYLTASPSNQTSFVSAQIPGGNSQYLGAAAGFRTGYTIIMCLLVLHSMTVSFTTWIFYSSKLTHAPRGHDLVC